MNQVFINAIQNRQLLSFTYAGYQRVVEPHTYGVTSKGKDSLRAYQVQGGHASSHNEHWHLFTVAKMTGISNTGKSFSGPRPDYKRNDAAMQRIYSQL